VEAVQVSEGFAHGFWRLVTAVTTIPSTAARLAVCDYLGTWRRSCRYMQAEQAEKLDSGIRNLLWRIQATLTVILALAEAPPLLLTV
jgi:hypothetical protein